ncbi:hypothetical protein B0H66DRAFT_634429 [Apodospora peruviana]|uniref:BTB domain-containing protein n=1 Tax=Apodospora peruviana TaxID=516989 RepID=A0AAE0IQF3_9PEZI|nr:hypothetical protein B0H66DRAFT_634429 [Apodospora peruviana]
MADYASDNEIPPSSMKSERRSTPTVRGHSSTPVATGGAAQPLFETVDGASSSATQSPLPSAPQYPAPEGLSELVEIMDGRGDLILSVGGEQREFLVCSRTLCRASPAFEKLCQQHVRSIDGFRRISLIDVGVTPMQIVLLVIHGSPTKVYPKMQDTKLLHDVLVVTHHFQMTDCLAPIAARWLKMTYNHNVQRYEDIAVQLWISHQLGHLGCLKQTIHSMVATSRLNTTGKMIGLGAADHDEYCNYPTLQSLDLLDKIEACRTRVINILLGCVNDAVKNLTESPRQPAPAKTNGPAQNPTVCKVSSEPPARRRQCDCRMLGALHRALYELNWHRIDYRSSSPHRLHNKIGEICRQTLKEFEPPVQAHKECDPFGGSLPQVADIVRTEVAKIAFDRAGFARRSQALGFTPAGSGN